MSNNLEPVWPYKCGCGRHYSECEWESLDYVGIQTSGTTGFPDLELRSCAMCDSTIAIIVTSDFIPLV